MSLSITISGNTTAELHAEAARLADVLEAMAGATTTGGSTEKRKPGRPAGAKATEAPAATEAAAPVESADDMAAALGLTDTPPASAEAKTPAYTMEQVKAALQELSKPRTGDQDAKAGLKRVVAVMEKIGVKMVKDIPAEKFADVIRLAQS